MTCSMSITENRFKKFRFSKFSGSLCLNYLNNTSKKIVAAQSYILFFAT